MTSPPTFIDVGKFHVNIMTGSGVMTIFVYIVLTRYPEIEKTLSDLSNIWRLRQFRDVKFGTNVSNNMSLHAAKCQGYSFYRFWVIKIKEKLTGAELINNHAVTPETSKHPVK